MPSNVLTGGRNTKLRNESVQIGFARRPSRLTPPRTSELHSLSLLRLQFSQWYVFFVSDKLEGFGNLVTVDYAYELKTWRALILVTNLINKMANQSIC